MTTRLIDKAPSEWTLSDATLAIQTALANVHGATGYAQGAQLVEDGDHWQNGDLWVGPRGNEVVWAAMKEGIEKQFTPVDVIGEVLDRYTSALTQREPDVAFVPRKPAPEGTPEAEAQVKEAAELREALSAWWDRAEFWERTGEAVTRARWAGSGNLRVWIAKGHLQAGKETPDTLVLPQGLTLADALGRVSVSAETPDCAMVYTDPVVQETVAVFTFVNLDGTAGGEIWTLDAATKTARLRMLTAAGVSSEVSIPMGGRLPIVQIKQKALLTAAIRRQQARLNFFETVLTHSVETAGFPERYLINAKPNGFWSRTPPANTRAVDEDTDGDGTKWYLHAAPRLMGASLTTDVIGIEDADGTPGAANIQFRDPSDPAWIINGSAHARSTILKSCHQGHVVNEGTIQASGTAYEQARADHESDINKARGKVEALVRNALESVIAMAEAMVKAGTPPVLERYRVMVTLHVTTGPVSPEKIASNTTLVEKGLMSRESAMAQAGIEDVAGEIARIDASPSGRLAILALRATTLKSLVDSGADLEKAAVLVGLTPDEAKALARADIVTGITQ